MNILYALHTMLYILFASFFALKTLHFLCTLGMT